MNHSAHQKTIKSASRQKHRQLEQNRERFKQKVQQQKPRTSNNTLHITTEGLQREKRLRKRAQKELHTAQKKLDQQQQIIKDQNYKLKNNQKQIADLKHERWELTASQKKVDELKQKIAELQSQVQNEQKERHKAEETIREMEIENEKRQKREKKTSVHTNRVKQLKQSNAALQRKLENYDLLTHQKYGNLEQEVKALRNEVAIHRHRERDIYKNPMHLIAYMKQHITSDYLPDLLDIVENFIKTDNLPYFYRGCHNLFYLFMRRVNLLAYQSTKKDNPYRLKNTENTDETTRLGYLTHDEAGWSFVDMSESSAYQVYPVIANITESHLTEDTPAKALLRQDGVKIVRKFSMSDTASIRQPKRKQTPKNHSKKQYQPFGRFNVLVIGSRFLSNYKNRLEKHGCITDIHNPYEESFDVLKGKVGRAEVILVCERHIPHSVWDYVDKRQPYVSVLKHDSKDLIATHAYLTLKRCELV